MAYIRVGTTKKSDATMEQVGGNDVYQMLSQIQEVLKQGGLGQNYLQLFTEPEDNGQEIDWYADGQSDAVPLKQLPSAERKAILGQLREMLENISKYVKTLRESKKSNEYKSYANIIEKALSFPGSKIGDYIYVVDGHPVMIGWGFREGDNSLVDGVQDLIRSVEKSIGENDSAPIKKEVKKQEEEPEIVIPAKKIIPEEKEPPVEEVKSEPVAREEPKPKAEETPKQVPEQEEKKEENPEKLRPQKTSEEEQTRVIEHTVTEEKNVATEPRKKGCGKIFLVILLLVLLAILAWFLFGRDNGPLGDLKGQYVSTGVLRNMQGQPVELLLTFPGTDGKGSFMISTPEQECTAPIQARSASGETVVIDLKDAVCPNGDDYENVRLTCNAKTMNCTGQSDDGANWNITLRRKD